MNDNTHVSELALHGEPQRLVNPGLRHVDAVQLLQQRWPTEPGAHIRGQPLGQIDAGQPRDGDELVAVLRVPRALQEGVQLFQDLIVPLLLPFHGGVVHLVDHHDQEPDAGRLGQDGVLTRLTSLLEPGLELALTGGDDQDPDVRLAGPPDHGRHEGLVPGGVQDGVPPVLGLEVARPGLVGLPLVTLLVPDVHSPRVLPRLAVLRLRLALELLQGPVIDHSRAVQQVAADGGLPGIDVADENQVQVWTRIADQLLLLLFFLRLLFRLVLGLVRLFEPGFRVRRCRCFRRCRGGRRCHFRVRFRRCRFGRSFLVGGSCVGRFGVIASRLPIVGVVCGGFLHGRSRGLRFGLGCGLGFRFGRQTYYLCLRLCFGLWFLGGACRLGR
mmetsp:Transcript_43778/g.73870  ORF Transcript_43778/g.73870 Transcript_43778/m.73870 type:complete len:385 (+) Transcript_43778:961-2115(+)